MLDPELFHDSLNQSTVVVLDEVHRFENRSGVLKIAADAYPHLRIVATGSSTLAATRKFRDSLTNRKHAIYVTPVPWSDCRDEFEIKDLERRLLHGGLPDPLLSPKKDP